jgi:hypothetical protein
MKLYAEQMNSSLTLLLSVVLLMPRVCHGQARCTWINEATAGGVLGGAVTVKVKLRDLGGGVCEFSRRQGTGIQRLRISVNAMTDVAKQFPTYLAQCRLKNTPLRAIGNEAVMCSMQSKRYGFGELLVGRVRDHAFEVSLSSSVRHDPSMTQETCREKAQFVAEQVAGILF